MNHGKCCAKNGAAVLDVLLVEEES